MIELQNKIIPIISLSIITEAIITYINQFFVGREFCSEMLLSVALGIVISVAYDVDIPKSLDFRSNIPYIGNILTGILISRGSNYIYDLMSKLLN